MQSIEHSANDSNARALDAPAASEWVTQAQREALRSLQDETLEALRRSLGGARECALIDFPDHPNVGDSLIWLGELAALSRLGVRIKYVCAEHNYDPEALRRRLDERTVILIHGGGNFGTLYVRHQRLRERILTDFPRHRTIQLSQSIDFEPGAALERMQRAVAQHRDFRILVRDRRSRAFAERHFECVTELCPDFALMLGPQRFVQRPAADFFILARTDKEKGADWSDALASLDPSTWRAGDWLEASPLEARLSLGAQLARRGVRKGLGSLAHVDVLATIWERSYRALGQVRMKRGAAALNQGRVVLTDRLHAHVLCVLMGKPHVVLGDANGKIRAFYDAYSHRLSPAPWSDTPAHAIAAADSLLRGCIR